MLDQLGVAADARDLVSLSVPLPGGLALPAPAGIFPRYVEAVA
jgi:methionyl-tRNA synthetase